MSARLSPTRRGRIIHSRTGDQSLPVSRVVTDTALLGFFNGDVV
jgi:hypothetical protein